MTGLDAIDRQQRNGGHFDETGQEGAGQGGRDEGQKPERAMTAMAVDARAAMDAARQQEPWRRGKQQDRADQEGQQAVGAGRRQHQRAGGDAQSHQGFVNTDGPAPDLLRSDQDDPGIAGDPTDDQADSDQKIQNEQRSEIFGAADQHNQQPGPQSAG
jgi:hypothetical protein